MSTARRPSDLFDSDIAWMQDAACVGENPDAFFPTRESSNNQLDAAKAICARCPVADACLEYAMRNTIDHGCWGGTGPDERRQLRRRRAIARKRAS